MEFNFNRLGFLLLKDIRYLVIPTVLITSIIYFAINMINFIALFNSNVKTLTIDNFYFTFIVSLAVIGSISFDEINKRNKRVDYLNLPASSIEKTISKFLSVMVMFPLLFIGVSLIFHFIFSISGNIIFQDSFQKEFFDSSLVQIVFWGLTIASFFTYGSIKYNTTSFVKIILWLLIIVGIWAGLNFLMGLSLFPELRAEIFGYDHDYNRVTNLYIKNHWIIRFIKNTYYLLPLIFWVLTYFALKEKEA